MSFSLFTATNDIPDEIFAKLPSEAVMKIYEIYASEALDQEHKDDLVDGVLLNLPEQLLDQMPEPPLIAKLPAEIKQRLNEILRQKNKPLAVKREECLAFVQRLPMKQMQAFFPGPFGFGAPKKRTNRIAARRGSETQK